MFVRFFVLFFMVPFLYWLKVSKTVTEFVMGNGNVTHMLLMLLILLVLPQGVWHSPSSRGGHKATGVEGAQAAQQPNITTTKHQVGQREKSSVGHRLT